LSRPQGHNAARRIRSIGKFDDFTGNRTRDLAACIIVLEAARLPHKRVNFKILYLSIIQEVFIVMLTEERRLKVFERWVVRRIFGHKREEVTRRLQKIP
jgi:hypothetical protein